MYILRALLTAGCFSILPSIVWSQTVVQVNFSDATLQVTENKTVVLQTRVVLPKGNYYAVPVSGTLVTSVMGPTWTPTPRMIATGKYKSSYGPYAQGNAMGFCKLSIKFNTTNRILRYVRIHGNAKESDLGKGLSAGCIRIPNSLCQSLINVTAGRQNVLIQFVR